MISTVGTVLYPGAAAFPKSDPIPIPGSKQRRIPMVAIQGAADKKAMDDSDIDAFCKAQRLIGQQKPEKEYRAVYCEEVYIKTDEQCYSQFSSTDWRLKEISIRATEVIISLLHELFGLSLPPGSVQIGGPSSKPPHEEKKLPYTPSLPHDLIKKIQAFQHANPHENPGPVFLKDLARRIRNVFENWMSAQLTSLKEELKPSKIKTECQQKELKTLIEVHLRHALYEPLACEVARRMLKRMDPALVDSLVEPHWLKTGSPGTREGIIEGKRETLSW